MVKYMTYPDRFFVHVFIYSCIYLFKVVEVLLYYMYQKHFGSTMAM